MMIEPTCVDCGQRFPREDDEVWRIRCVPCWRAMKHAEKAAGAKATVPKVKASSPIPPARLKELVQLCHPDRHQGSPLSQKVTAWLLGFRQVR